MDGGSGLPRGSACDPSDGRLASGGGRTYQERRKLQPPTFSWYAVCKGDEKGTDGPLGAHSEAHSGPSQRQQRVRNATSFRQIQLLGNGTSEATVDCSVHIAHVLRARDLETGVLAKISNSTAKQHNLMKKKERKKEKMI